MVRPKREKLILRAADIARFALMDSNLPWAFDQAGSYLKGEMHSAGWKKRSAPRFTFIPAPGENNEDSNFHFLMAGGTTRRLVGPAHKSLNVARSEIPHLKMYTAMRSGHFMATGGMDIVRRPRAHAFILRPRSILMLRYAAISGRVAFGNEQDPESLCELFFAPQITGHDRLEEAAAIEADFPGTFEIRV